MKREEAIEVIKKHWPAPSHSILRESLQALIPELAESEDERVRKDIIALIEFGLTDGSAVSPGSRTTKEEALAYLEKQKYDRMKPIYDAKESFESALEKAWNNYHNGYENVDKLEDDYVECAHAKGFREGYLFGIEKQKEQKPTELPKSKDYGIDGLYAAVDILQKTLGKVDEYQTDDGILEHKCAISAVKELYEQKPAEWSEEDEANWQNYIKQLELQYSKGPNVVLWDDINWLKYLHNKFKSLSHSWKPSEEQMDALEIIVSAFQSTALESLYYDLKKLM